MNIEDAEKILRDHAASLDVPYPHWVGGDNVDQGPSYCRACADAKVEAGEAEYVDDGWQQDDDGCCHCDTCGMLLEYNLTEYGAAAELEHYLASPPEQPVTPEDAFHILKIFERDETDARVIAIVISTAKLINLAADSPTL